MFELLPATQANSVLPVELPHCVDTTNTEIHSFQKFTINSDASLGSDQVLPPKKFTFDFAANLGSDQVAPRPR